MASPPPPPWSDLPIDLLQHILERLTTDCLDLLRCRGVCTLWRGIATPLYHKLKPFLPPLLFHIRPEKSGEDERGGCYVSTTKKPNQFHCISSLETRGRWFCNSPFGWALIVDGVFPHETHLFSPFTKAHIRLPPWSDIKDLKWLNVITSTSPSDPNCIVLVTDSRSRRLAFCKPGDQRWSITLSNVLDHDIIFYKDEFYMVNILGHILKCNFGGSLDFQLYPPTPGPGYAYTDHFLVESTMGEFLLVTRQIGLDPWLAYNFEVHKLDWKQKVWTYVTDLGDEAIFLGKRSSISVSASHSEECRANCIYFIADIFSDHDDPQDFGVFDLGNKRWKGLQRFLPAWTRTVSWMRPEILKQ